MKEYILKEAKYLAEQSRYDSTDRVVSTLADALLLVIQELECVRGTAAKKNRRSAYKPGRLPPNVL